MSWIGSFDLSPNSLYYGDCLEVMKGWPDEQVDLIYLDPPFNSKADYNVLFGTEDGVPAQVRAFTDTWTWNEAAAKRYKQYERAVARPAHRAVTGLHQILGPCGMLAYLTYMAERLTECKRMLKPTGSIYLHCDPTAGHYLKIIMDSIFGVNSFTNELIWYYTNASRGKKQFAKAHDIIFWYSKRPGKGLFNREEMLVPFASGMTEWRYTKGGQKGQKMPRGKTPDDVIELPSLNSMAKERLKYDTQKPIALLERIIKASSDEGDLVLDPFCGCGTTLEAANNLNRRWVGIDISPFAVRLVQEVRLKDASIPIHGIPADLEGARTLLRRNPFDFEAWIVMAIEGLAANEVQVGDGGIDGRGQMYTVPEEETGLVLAQVKGGGYTASALRDFEGAMGREKATAGIFVTLDRVPTARAHAVAEEMGTYTVGASRYPRLQFWSVEEHLSGVRPHLPAMADPYTGKAVQTDMFTKDNG